MSIKSPVSSLKFELTNQIKAVHSARDDVYIQVPDIKKEDMIPWSMQDPYYFYFGPNNTIRKWARTSAGSRKSRF